MKKLSLNHSKGCRMNYFILVVPFLITSFSLSLAQVSIVKDAATGNSNDPQAFGVMHYHAHDGNLYFQYYQELWKSDGTTAGTGPIQVFDNLANVTSSGHFVYFTADRYEEDLEVQTGHELWRTDGTPEGTILLKDIYPGDLSSNIHSLTDVGGTLFFVANNGVNGEELWKSNGTPGGTVLVKDILRVGGSSKPRHLTELNGKLYFSANDGQKGFELWTSNGTTAGTVIAKDINPVYKGSSSPDQLLNVNGTLYFLANDGSNGKQLWKSNGAIGNATLVKIIRPGANNLIDKLTKLGNDVFFQAHDGIHGIELWKSNGTSNGTFMVKDLTPGPGSETMYATPHIDFLGESNGRMYFLAVSGGWQDLWVSNGTTSGTYPITSRNDPGFPWRHFGIIAYKGLSYFAGAGNDENFFLELWKTDGTVAGTSMVYENIGDGYIGEPRLTVYKDKIYLFGKGELWRTDGTPSGIEVVKKFGQQAGINPLSLTDINGQLYFEGGWSPTALWRSDGTPGGTIEVRPGFRNITQITNVDGTVYFSGLMFPENEELWKSNGTTEGTSMVVDLTDNPDATYKSSVPRNLTEYNDKLYFNAYTPYNNPQLFVSDGTPGGTQPLGIGEAKQLTEAGGKLFFTASGSQGNELYVYDGSNPPVLTRDIKLHWQGSYPINLTPFNGVLYFQADNRGNGYELWRSDGTTAGTYIMKDIRREDLGSGEVLAPVDMGNMMATTDALYFTAIKPTGKNALWKSNGTPAGTRPLVEFARTPVPWLLATAGNTLTYLLHYESYVELWRSDGTVAGTTMISTLPEASHVFFPPEVETYNGVHYFFATDLQQYLIWRTDGTPEGTYQIEFSGTPHEMEVSGGKLYLSLNHPEYGWELFTVNDTGTPAISAARTDIEEVVVGPSDNSENLLNYPNPFTSKFTLKVLGAESEEFQMNAINVNGAVIDSRKLMYNTEHTLGQSWHDGLYIIQIFTENKMLTQKVIKRN